MGFFDFLKLADINDGVSQFTATSGAVLLDVRTPVEYKEGHVPQSKNIPLQDIQKTESIILDKETPLFVYCLSGGRSRQAVSALVNMGYKKVTNIGGINNYRGKVER